MYFRIHVQTMKILSLKKNFQKKYFLKFMYKPCIFGKESQGNFSNSCTNHENFKFEKKISKNYFFEIHVQTMYF